MAWKSTGSNPPTPQTPNEVRQQDSYNPSIGVFNPMGETLPATPLVVDTTDSSSTVG